jgi:hypothetical protein
MHGTRQIAAPRLKGTRLSSNSPHTPPAERQLVAERITVGLIPKVANELNELVRTTGLTKTDLVNRALTLSAFVNEQLAAGNHLVIRNGKTGETERVTLL